MAIPKNWLRNVELVDFAPTSAIYAIINKQTGRAYVGQSRNVAERILTHVKHLTDGGHSNLRLLADFTLYGLGGFVFRVLEICPEDELVRKEMQYIGEYSGLCGVYNTTRRIAENDVDYYAMLEDED